MSKLPLFERVKTHGSKDLNLFVGLYYTVSVKSIPNCFVTYEPETREGTNLMQIAFHDTEEYEEGGACRSHVLWTILPGGTGSQDYFLKALSQPEGVLTYSHSLSWGGRYLELDLIHPENYKPGANMYTSSLWHFGSTELPEYFTIHNSDERRNLNFVTFSNEPASNGQLMQIGTKDLHFYQPKGQFRNDALWNFRPANFTIQARVCKFEFELPSKDDLESLAIPIQVSDEVAIVNDTEKPFVVVDEAVKLNESVVVCFLQSFKMFDEENVSVECDILSQIAEVCGNSTPQVSTKFDKTTNTQWSAAKEREFPINQRVPLDPKSIANVTCFCNWIFNVEIPFSAIVEVRAASDVALCPTPVELQCIHTEMQDERIVEYLLKYEKFTGKVVPKNKNVPQGAIHCRVMGRVKVSCGLNAKLKVKYCS